MGRLLGINPGEGRIVSLIVSTSFVASAGLMIAQSAVDALFFARYGVEKLPVMYLLLGFLMFAVSLGVSVLLGRLGRTRTFMVIPLSIAVAAIGARMGLLTGSQWIYAVLWLVVAMSQFVIALTVWGLAGIVTDTRQAKRFFPLIGAGGILGLVAGGLITKPLVSALGADNLILVWAGTLGGVVLLAARLLPNPERRPPRRRQLPALKQMKLGVRSVRSSSLMRWMAVGATMFSLLFFSLYLPFSRAASARYSSPDQLAGFFGVFFGLSTAAALIVSVLITNRLLSRFGVPTVLLVLPLVYVAAFGVLAVHATFAVLASFRFAQIVWLQGGAFSASEAVINTVPADRRDQTRTFLYGGATQAGTVAAGVIALISEQAASPRLLYDIGLASALVALVAMARVRREYVRELVFALSEGRPNVFGAVPVGQEAFNLRRADASAVSVATDGLSDADPRVRRLAAFILGDLRAPAATIALVRALDDSNTDVQTTALRSLGRAGDSMALPEVSERVSDPVPEVRMAALDAFSSLGVEAETAERTVRPLLQDPRPDVRVRGAAFLLEQGPNPEAEATLVEMGSAPEPPLRVESLKGLVASRSAKAYKTAVSAIGDPAPAVRAEAARALAAIDPARAIEPLLAALADNDEGVRGAIAEALTVIGPRVVPQVVSCLFDPDRQPGALAALEHLPLDGAAADVRRFAAESVSRAVESHRLSGLTGEDPDERLDLLRASLLARSQREAVAGLRAAALLGDRTAMGVALESISVTDSTQRANALEVIESVGDPELVRPLLPLWEAGRPPGTDPLPVERLTRDQDDWIRACAELVMASRKGGSVTRTLPTLPLMERVIFLRKVPLFADLSPPDLKPIALIAEEETFADGDTIGEKGESGDAMYVIVSGEVSVVVNRQDPDEPLAVRSPGDVIGEMAVISSKPRMASLVARGPVRVLTIEPRQFQSLLRERPEISLAVMRVLCERLADRDTEGV